MRIVKWASVALLGSCVNAPAFAQECFRSTDWYAASVIAEMSVVFSDESEDVKFKIIQNDKGNWVAYVEDGEVTCVIAYGDDGKTFPRKPNV